MAVNWLKRPQSRGGHGCKVAIDECRTGWSGEIPDALGYHFAGSYMDGTVLVVRMFDRISDPEKIVDLDKERNRLAFRVNDLATDLRRADGEVQDLSLKVRA